MPPLDLGSFRLYHRARDLAAAAGAPALALDTEINFGVALLSAPRCLAGQGAVNTLDKGGNIGHGDRIVAHVSRNDISRHLNQFRFIVHVPRHDLQHHRDADSIAC